MSDLHEGEPHGEVRHALTLLRGAPVVGGLFDPEIFGPLDGSARRWGRLELGMNVPGSTHTWIAVPPIADRMPSRPDPAMRVPWHGRVNAAWLALIQAAQRRAKLVELGVPGEVLARETAHVQAHLDDVIALQRGQEPPPHHPHAPPEDPIWLVWPCMPRGDELRALLFLDEDRLLVQTRRACRVIDRAGRTIGEPFKPTGLTATSVHGDLVLFGGSQREMFAGDFYAGEDAWPEEAVHRVPLAAYDLRARRWVDVVDERLPSWIVDETDVEGADALVPATLRAASLTLPPLRGEQLAQTRDGRFVYLTVHHGDVVWADSIVEIATQRVFVEPPAPRDDLPVVSVGPTTLVRAPSISYAPSTGWRILDPSGAIGDGEHAWFRLAGATRSAWSPSGAELATVAGGELVILDVAPGGARVVSRAAL